MRLPLTDALLVCRTSVKRALNGELEGPIPRVLHLLLMSKGETSDGEPTATMRPIAVPDELVSMIWVKAGLQEPTHDGRGQ